MALTFATFLCLASGFLLVSTGWSRVQPVWADFLFRASLTIGFGLGVFSIAFFLYRAFEIKSLVAADLAFLLLLLCARFLLGNRAVAAVLHNPESSKPPRWLRRTVTAALAIAFFAAVVSAIRQTLAHPHGDGWDAFAIWNLHARFLFLGGPHWRSGFTPLLPWSHPDYPLLVPASIAHFWTYLGYDSPIVPAVIGIAFMFGTVGILLSALAILRGGLHAMLAATALLATPSFVEQGTWQYADVPLSFFLLSTVALLCLNDEIPRKDRTPAAGLLVLAGIAAGLGAWTKNEGLLFLCALILARQWTFLRYADKGLKIPFRLHSALLLAGIVPFFLLIVAFKHWIAPPGELFSDASSIVQRLRQPARYWAVLNWYGKEFLRFGEWLGIPGTLLLGGLYGVASRGDEHRASAGRHAAGLALVLTFAGYAFIYLITPYDIYWHLRFSLGRLFIQLWPATIFLVFLAMPPEEMLFPADVSK